MGKKKEKRIIPQSERYARFGYWFILPWMIGFTVFTFGPMVFSLYLSLTDFAGTSLRDASFVGLGNFKRLFTDSETWHSLKVTLKFGMMSLPLGLVAGFLLAYLLNMKVPLMKMWRTIFYLPAMISGVIVATLWRGLFDDKYGIINYLLGLVNINGPQWLLDPKYILYCFLFLSVWGCGGGMVVYLSGLQSIPTALYEAAEIDGCNKFQQLIFITIPQMTPIFFFNIIMGLIGAFQYFAEPMTLVGANGGQAKAALFYNLYLYNHAFRYRNMGYASALAWFLFVIVLALTLLVFKSSELWVFYEAEVKK